MILVAGGTGRLGSLVVNSLCAGGHTVRVLSRGLTSPGSTLDSRAEQVEGDVRDPASLRAAAEGVRLVVSCVQGFMGPGHGTPLSVDRFGNFNLVDAAKSVAADFVLVSMTGASPHSPMELARMKYAAESHLRASGRGWTIIRAAAFAQAWLGIIAETARASGRPLVFGAADNAIPWVDVHEVAELVVRATEEETLRGQVLEICGPEPLTLMQLAQAYMDHAGLPGRPRRIPRSMLHVMSGTVGRLRPDLGRQARAALAMDELPLPDDSATRERFPDLPRRPVSEVIAGLPLATG